MSNVSSVKFALKLSMKEERNVVSAIIEEREESKVDAVAVEQVKLLWKIFNFVCKSKIFCHRT